jgi:hypothetical protein
MPRKKSVQKPIEQDIDARHGRNTRSLPEQDVSKDDSLSRDSNLSPRAPATEYSGWLDSSNSDQQLADTMISLQQSHGNAYVGQILGHLQNSQKDQSQPAPVQIDRAESNNGYSVNLSTVIPGPNDARQEDEQPVDIKWTSHYAGVKDSINPGTIFLNQQTQAGGATVPGKGFGYTNITIEQNVHVEPIKRWPSGTDYSVTCRMSIWYNLAIQSQGRADVTGAGSPAVKEDTWSEIIYDLTPTGSAIPWSPREKFWSSDLTLAHEQFHADDYTGAYERFCPLEETWLQQQKSRSIESASLKGQEACRRLNARVTAYMGETDDSPREVRAYNAGVAGYEARAQDIQNRADAEGWSTTEEDEGDIMTEVNEEEETAGEEAEEDSVGGEVESDWEEEPDGGLPGGLPEGGVSEMLPEGGFPEEESEEAVGSAVSEERDEEED